LVDGLFEPLFLLELVCRTLNVFCLFQRKSLDQDLPGSVTAIGQNVECTDQDLIVTMALSGMPKNT
jgi:hypothetical protein